MWEYHIFASQRKTWWSKYFFDIPPPSSFLIPPNLHRPLRILQVWYQNMPQDTEYAIVDALKKIVSKIYQFTPYSTE